MFISLAIWSINSMGNKQCISLNLLLSDDTFAVISVMTTLGTAILGGIAPSIYGIFTSPIDKKSSFRAISDWEQEQRNNVKDLMMLLPFTLLSILIVIFIFQFAYSKLFNTIAIIILVVMFFLILLICYKITVMICRYFSKE
ncbi:TPA: hypothetical protein ACGFPS_001406 [Staphylococcus aureus]|uniref:hypothetical protein n=1 Tax=Staphylococcus aureus TaxID=1280 RepID=UPI0009909D1E|nr:hypothetical protein [Staphylococcus aureus]MCE7817117.1 hypothetical protein [Staphylococcus aureus]HCZ2413684.1 hypothetical protein [Staphylococcus aureus]HDI7682524.1 hypothetical protein [Staphylococcus aureus]HDK7671562.1 hypothetical protein [Staphylococcus aureus]HDK7714814.1 hypothetical protein [Staphylococcus aureus]